LVAGLCWIHIVACVFVKNSSVFFRVARVMSAL